MGKPKRIDWSSVLAEHVGRTHTEIARIVGCSRPAVSMAAKRIGAKVWPRPEVRTRFDCAREGDIVRGAVFAKVDTVGEDGSLHVSARSRGEDTPITIMPPLGIRPFWVASVVPVGLSGFGLSGPDEAVEDLVRTADAVWAAQGFGGKVGKVSDDRWRQVCFAAALLQAAGR